MELGGDRTHNAAGVEERNAHSGTTPQHLRIHGGVVDPETTVCSM
jgi:hypothetical protein